MGRPAWMPGEPRWAMDGPWRRAHGAEPERGNLSVAKAVRWGEDFLVPFWSFKKGLAVRAKPIFQLDAHAGYVRGGPVNVQRTFAVAPCRLHREQARSHNIPLHGSRLKSSPPLSPAADLFASPVLTPPAGSLPALLTPARPALVPGWQWAPADESQRRSAHG